MEDDIKKNSMEDGLKKKMQHKQIKDNFLYATLFLCNFNHQHSIAQSVPDNLANTTTKNIMAQLKKGSSTNLL